MDIDLAASADAECLALDFASTAGRRQHGVTRPRLVGLASQQILPAGTVSGPRDWLWPQVGAAVALVLGRQPADTDRLPSQLAGLIDFVLPALVILDSPDGEPGVQTVAVVLSDVPAVLDLVGLRTAGSLLLRNGELAATGAPGVLLGSPLTALSRVVAGARQTGSTLRAGQCVVLSSITPTIGAEPGDRFSLRITGLGTIDAQLGASEREGSTA